MAVAWEYKILWFNRVSEQWHTLPQEQRSWDAFRSCLLPWQDVVDWMNEIGKSGWEIYHVREEFNANWDDERLVRGIAASSATEQIDLVLNTPEANAEREANLIFFYARRPREGASS